MEKKVYSIDGKELRTINLDDKIVQFIPFVIDINGITVDEENDVPRDSFYTEKSVRGDKGFGSTGLA